MEQTFWDLVVAEYAKGPIEFLWKFLITPLGLLWAGWSQWSERRAKKRQEAAQEEAAAMHAINEKMERDQDQLKAAVRDRAMDWGDRCINTLSEAWVLLRGQTEGRAIDEAQANALMGRLSALVDTGRLFFPNHSGDLPWPTWERRPPAMKGFRDPALDCLMIVHDELNRARFRKDLTGDRAVFDNVFEARRAFVSYWQGWVNPLALGMGSEAAHNLQDAKAKAPPPEDPWELMRPIVASFEGRYPMPETERTAMWRRTGFELAGGAFWNEAPMSRKALEAAIRDNGAPKRYVAPEAV